MTYTCTWDGKKLAPEIPLPKPNGKFPTIGGHDFAGNPNGYTLNKSKFAKTGTWKVKARAASPNSPWCDPVNFVLKQRA